jgi:hypothetical protein
LMYPSIEPAESPQSTNSAIPIQFSRPSNI